jgi:pyruvate kinase
MDTRRTKIVATIGPASQDENTLTQLFQAGVDVARLNFSHGTHEQHAKTIEKIRETAHRLGKPIAIMQDLQGPKIRTGDLSSPIEITKGDKIALTTDPDPTAGVVPIDYPGLHEHLQPGSRILLDDGNIELVVDQVVGKKIDTTVSHGGLVKSDKGINLPGTNLDIPGFTSKDEEDLKFGLSQGVDAVAISFVRTAQDVVRVRQAIQQNNKSSSKIPIIAKLERPEALENLKAILEVADGLMVARGDLGVELSPESVPIAQKQIIEAANRHRKVVITATQMLDSMIHHPRPTRAETTDVANAIFDGTDAVMLSGETAIGDYPVITVKMMRDIILQSEEYLTDWGRWHGYEVGQHEDDAISITNAAKELAHDLNVSAIVVFTQSGRTALLMSKSNPRVPILGFTPNEDTYRKMAFYWGVYPHLTQFANSFEEMLAHVESAMIASTPIKQGQQVVVISGFPVNSMRLPNLALLYTVGQRS